MEKETTYYLQAAWSSAESIIAVSLVYLFGHLSTSLGLITHEHAAALDKLSRKLFLPLTLIAVLGSQLSLQTLVSYWPIPLFAALFHLLPLALAYASHKLFSLPAWIVETLPSSNAASYPLLLLPFLAQPPNGPLTHLTPPGRAEYAQEVAHKAAGAALVWTLFSELYNAASYPLIDKLTSASEEPSDPKQASLTLPPADQPGPSTSSSERTPLLASQTPSAPQSLPTTITPSPLRPRRILLHPLLLSSLAALLALLPPLHSALFRPTHFLSLTLGSAIRALAQSYAALSLFSLGALSPHTSSSTSSTLGPTLLLTTYKFALAPLLSISLLSALRPTVPSPSLTFVLALLPSLPPSVPTPLTARAHALAPLAAFTIAAALVATPGSGVVFKPEFDLGKALKSAAGGGVAGAMAMVLQVLLLMPLRTVMNTQYRFGGTLSETWKTLHADGGAPRFWAGLPAALIQGPVSRFGDTAANAGILALLESVDLPVLVKTIGASVASALFRMTLTPVDALKTTQQTAGGARGLRLLRERVRAEGVGSLWYGAWATAAATAVGFYPWFASYNFLQDVLPEPHNVVQKLLRQALIGFVASVVSDTISNSLRVIKTYRQVHESEVGYTDAAKAIIEQDGWRGLFGRGLKTRILTNGLQGVLFSVLWRLFQDLLARKTK